MSGEKIKIKELASMLKVDPKDLLQQLKDMGFEVKTISSSIPSFELDRIKTMLKKASTAEHAPIKHAADKHSAAEHSANTHFADKPESKNATVSGESSAEKADDHSSKQVERKEVQPGVIIRRRRKEAEPEAPMASQAASETPLVSNEAANVEVVAQASSEETPEPKINKPEEPAAKIVSKPRKPVQQETPAAKIISKPEEKRPEPEVVLPEETAPTSEAEDKAEAKAKKETTRHIARPDATFEPDPEDVARSKAIIAAALRGPEKTETGEEPAAKAAEPERKRAEEPSSPHVRIISRPDPIPDLPQLPADGAPDANKEAGARSDRHDPKSAIVNRYGEPGAKGYDAERDGVKKKRGLAARRTVDFRDFEDDAAFDAAQAELNPELWSEAGAARPHSRRPKRHRKDHRQAAAAAAPIKVTKRKIKIDEFIKVGDLAHEMGVKSTEVIKVLMQLGTLATINQALDLDTATLVAAEFSYEVEKVGFSEDDYLIAKEADNAEDLLPRPPVVTIMGHVDHGKTSLLDAIRKSAVAKGEAGGITQHIGAYHVTTSKGDIVFLDTPGHEAFTAMRARGAEITDIVVLVVAADDGVMEQTREAINHSQAAGVPIMVAVNKMDKESANPERVLRELSELGLVSEEWGGDTMVVNVSAKSGQGIDDLLELLALQAEVMELKANPNKPARGHIVEAKLDKGRGPVATVLIQEGTLKLSDVFVCGVFSGRVRAMLDDQGKNISQAGPSMPVEVHGFEGVPEAGEEFISVADEKLARKIVDERAIKLREKELARESKVTLETFLASRPTDIETLVLNLVLKTDVQGSLEAITEALLKMGTEKVKVNVVHGGAGSITESDVLLASASNAIIIGFNVRPAAKVKELAEQEKVEIRFYDIIYNLSDEIRKAMEGLLAPVLKEVYLGQVEIRQTFSVPKVGTIAGCFVVDGKITRNAEVRLLREGVVVYTGKTASLKRFKDDVREVLKGYECGLSLENFNDIKVGDIVEAFEQEEQAAKL